MVKRVVCVDSNGVKKSCPKCGEPLMTADQEGASLYCRNGCEIYTAMPHGSGFNVRNVGSVFGPFFGGGIRRSPVFEE